MAEFKQHFRNFLDRAEDDGWIAGYKWFANESFVLLKEELGERKDEHSRTHKRGNDGVWYALEVEGHFGTAIGVDLELLVDRPILQNPSWIANRLGLSRSSDAKYIIEEWSCREASYKALAPDNEGLLVSQFRRTSPNTLTVFGAGGERSVQTRTAWHETWVLSLAWRSL